MAVLLLGQGLLGQSTDPVTTKTSDDAVLHQARRALVKLKIATSYKGVYLNTTATLIDDEQLIAVTKFAPLRGAPSGTAYLADLQQPVTFDILSIKPRLNLALIQLNRLELPKYYKPQALPIPEKDSVAGSRAFVIGFDKFGELAINTGTIDSLKPWISLDEKARKALPYHNLSHWILTSHPNRLETAGGPLIDTKGNLLGLSTWVWSEQNSSGSSRGGGISSRFSRSRTPPKPPAEHYAIDVAHIRAMYKTRPTKPMGFKMAQSRYGLARVPHDSLDRLSVDSLPIILPKGGTPEGLWLAAEKFAKQTPCPLCKGEGEVKNPHYRPDAEDQQRTQSNQRNPTNSQNVSTTSARRERQRSNKTDKNNKTDEFVECPRCLGDGLQKDARSIFNLGRFVALALASIDQANPESQAARVHMEEKLFDVMEMNPQALARRLNLHARKQLHATNLTPGTAVMLIGVAETKVPVPGGPREALLVQTGEFGPTVLAMEPGVASVEPNGIVLVAGLLSGYLDNDQGKPVPIIQRGFVMNIPQTEKGTAGNFNAGGNGNNGSRSSTSRTPGGSSSGRSSDERREAWRNWMRQRIEMFTGRGGSSSRDSSSRFRR